MHYFKFAHYIPASKSSEQTVYCNCFTGNVTFVINDFRLRNSCYVQQNFLDFEL